MITTPYVACDYKATGYIGTWLQSSRVHRYVITKLIQGTSVRDYKANSGYNGKVITKLQGTAVKWVHLIWWWTVWHHEIIDFIKSTPTMHQWVSAQVYPDLAQRSAKYFLRWACARNTDWSKTAVSSATASLQCDVIAIHKEPMYKCTQAKLSQHDRKTRNSKRVLKL